MGLAIIIGNLISRNVPPGFPPAGSDEIVTETGVQMVTETGSNDLITEY
jgi:hypothetical protein|tara:strand:+ start:248 stop:394 length:147 start_codon:yes stop_codon:yes gene_type:complete